MLSDWFENVLLARSPDTYPELGSRAELWGSAEAAGRRWSWAGTWRSR